MYNSISILANTAWLFFMDVCHAMLCCACSRSELAEFGEPDFVIYNGGCFPANKVRMVFVLI
jgi:hypothetical protein